MRTLFRFLVGSLIAALSSCAAFAAPLAYIPNAYSNNVSVIDTATNTVVATVRVGSYPVGVAVSAAGTRVYVNNVDGDSVSVIDATINSVVATVPVGANPSGVATGPTGRWVYVGGFQANNLSVIDGTNNTVVATIPLGSSPMGIVADPTGSRVYVTGPYANTVWVVDTATNRVVSTVPAVPFAGGVALNAAGTLLYVTNIDANSLSVIDTSTSTVIAVVPVGAAPAGVALNPAGTRAYVTNADANTVSVIDTVALTVIATIPVGAYPIGIAVTPSGARVYVANADSNSVSVLDGATNTVATTVRVGGSPFAFGQFIGPDVAIAQPRNYQGMWAVPNLDEAGWGINFTHQGDLIFASWFTYDASGRPWWLTMTARQQSDGSFTGPIDLTSGPPFNADPFDPARVTHTTVGAGRLSFGDANNGSFAYTVNGIAQTKALSRFQFATPVPTCTFNSPLAPAQATNYQDMWAVPNLAEAGWGINFTHQDDIIFASWFTYDANGNPLWVTATLPKTTARTYAGALDATTGPPFYAQPFDPLRVTHSPVGAATVTFTDGTNATFAYTLNGVSQTKALTRFVFRAPGTVCQ